MPRVSVLVVLASALVAHRLLITRRIPWRVFTPRLLWLFNAWALLSVSWGGLSRPPIVLALYIAGGTCAVGLMRVVPENRLSVLIASCKLALAGVLLGFFVASAPFIGAADTQMVGWRGAFPTKNNLGFVACQCFVILLTATCLQPPRQRLWSRFGWIGISIGLLGVSGSASAIAASVAAVTIFALRAVHLGSSSKRRSAAFAISCAGGLLWCLSSQVLLSSIFGLLGRSSNLTGRPALWSAIIDEIKLKPYIGYGLEHPWRGNGFRFVKSAPESVTLDIWSKVGWTPPSAHNSFVDVWLQLGLVGLVLFVLLIGGALKRGLEAGRGEFSMTVGIYGAVLAIYSLSESVYFSSWGVFSLSLGVIVALGRRSRTLL